MPLHPTELALAAALAGDDPEALAAARWGLVEQWKRMAYKKGKEWWAQSGKRGDRADWQHAALLGLMDAAGLVGKTEELHHRRSTGANNGRYDPAKGVGFGCYAGWYLFKWLQEHAHQERAGVVRRPRVPGAEVKPVMGFPAAPDGSVWEPAVREDDEPPPDPEEVWGEVDAILTDPRDQMVVWLRFRCGYRLRDIARHLRLSHERVRQIEKAAMARLRERMMGGVA